MSSISRRKLSSTEDFLKLLADGIRQEKMGLKGADKGYTLNFLEIIPQKITPVDVLSANPNTQSIGETAIPSDINLSYTETATSYHIAFGNDATLFGATWTATSGKYRGGLNFDGTDDYAQVQNSASLTILSAVSVFAWINPDAAGGTHDQWVVVKKASSWSGGGYGLFFGWGVDLAFSIGLQTTSEYVFYNVAPAPWGNWTHVGGVYDGVQSLLYVNGSQVASATMAVSLSTTNNNLRISDTTGRFGGVIDEVSVYNRALSTSEIQNIYNGVITKDGLVMYLSFDEGSGSTSTDLSGALIEYSEMG